MNLESLRLLRNILLRSVVIGMAFALFFAAVTFGAWDAWIGNVTKWCHTDEAHIGSLILTFFTEIRFLLVFLLLTPALAIHWTIKRELSRTTKATAGSPAPSQVQSVSSGKIVTQQ